MMQNPRCGFTHSLGSYVRFTIDEARDSFRVARAIQAELQGIAGARLVSINPKTGNALILYESDETTPDELEDQVRKLGYLLAV